MTASPALRQLDLFAPPVPKVRPAPLVPTGEPGETVHPDDAIIEALIQAREADWYSVSHGYHPRDPHHMEREAPWNTPSRLFTFPYRFHRVRGGSTTIAVKHPLLLDHPHVVALATRSGFPAIVDPADHHGGEWQHAVDLCTPDHWKTLLALQGSLHKTGTEIR